MSDILEHLHNGMALSSEQKEAADEIESLRQRVKELEGYEQECANLDAELKDYQNCLAELAALKGPQTGQTGQPIPEEMPKIDRNGKQIGTMPAPKP